MTPRFDPGLWTSDGTCADHGDHPCTGPTAEQLRILDFRDALTATLPPCAKLGDIEAKVAELSAADQVGRWTVKWGAPDGWSGCVGAQVHEADREVWVNPAAPPGEGLDGCYPSDLVPLGCPPPRWAATGTWTSCHCWRSGVTRW